LSVLREAARLRSNNEVDGPIFPRGKGTARLSEVAIRGVLRRMQRSDLTVHGFRSSFRDWAAETTSYQREAVEAALAHTIDSKVEAAYRRGDLFEKRRRLMNDWAAYCGRVEPASVGRVVRIGSAA
jgi:integrase